MKVIGLALALAIAGRSVDAASNKVKADDEHRDLQIDSFFGKTEDSGATAYWDEYMSLPPPTPAPTGKLRFQKSSWFWVVAIR